MNEFRKAWPTLLGAFLGVATGISSLLFYSQGLFIKPIALEFGWSRGQASLGPLVGALTAAIAAPLAGRIMDRVGPVRLALASMAALALGLAALGAFISDLPSFLLITIVIAIGAIGSSPLSYSGLLVSRFDRHRGLALGLALAGTGVGAALIPVLLGPYIADHGWRAGYFALAVVVLVAIAPIGLLLRGGTWTPADRASPPKLSSVVGEPRFLLLCFVFLLAAIGVSGTIVHFPAMLSDAGLAPRKIGAIAGSIGIAVVVGRAMSGLLLDRIAARYVTSAFFGLSAVGVSLMAIGGVGYGLVGALAIGVSIGAEVDLIAYLVSRMFDNKVFGAAYGGIYASFLIGGAAGPAIIGFLFDATGKYQVPLLVAGLCLALAALGALRIPITVRTNV